MQATANHPRAKTVSSLRWRAAAGEILLVSKTTEGHSLPAAEGVVNRTCHVPCLAAKLLFSMRICPTWISAY